MGLLEAVGVRRTSNHGEEVARQNFLLGASCPFHVEMEEGRDRRCRAGCLVVDGCHRVMENHRASIHHDVAAEVRHVASPYDCYRMTCWIRYQNCAITINGKLSTLLLSLSKLTQADRRASFRIPPSLFGLSSVQRRVPPTQPMARPIFKTTQRQVSLFEILTATTTSQPMERVLCCCCCLLPLCSVLL